MSKSKSLAFLANKSQHNIFLSMGKFIELGLMEDYYYYYLLHLICFVNKVVIIEKVQETNFMFIPFCRQFDLKCVVQLEWGMSDRLHHQGGSCEEL